MPVRRGRRAAARRAALGGLLLAACAATGCGLQIPTDPGDTLERVRGGALRVGASPSEPWVVVEGGDRPPSGLEPALVRRFAASLGARVEWSAGGEEELIGELERGELDLVVGGLTAQSPWSEQAALTRPYTTTPGPEGAPQDHVMAARLGENAFLLELERFLLSRRA